MSIGRVTRRAAPAALLCALAACATSSASTGKPSPSATATASPSVSVSPSINSSATATPAPREVPASWMRISSAHAGVAFAFPPMGSAITYRAGRASSGASYSWTFERAGADVPLAGAATPDFDDGRRLRPTDAARWKRTSGTWRVLYPGSYEPVVHPLRVVTRSDGLIGIVFDARDFWGTGDPPQNDRIAVLNFPRGQHPELGAIAFYFLEETWIEDIDLVVRSVTFSPPSADLPDAPAETQSSPPPNPTITLTFPPRPRPPSSSRTRSLTS